MKLSKIVVLICALIFSLKAAQRAELRSALKRKLSSLDSTITDSVSMMGNEQSERTDSCNTTQVDTISLDLDSLPLPVDTPENHELFDTLEARSSLVYSNDQFAFLDEMSPTSIAAQMSKRYHLNLSKNILDLFNDHVAVINYNLVDAWAQALAEENGGSLYSILLHDKKVYKLPINAACSTTGMSALMVAAKTGPLAFVQLLLVHGARTNLQDNKGRTAHHIACEHHQKDIADFLMLKKIFSHYYFE